MESCRFTELTERCVVLVYAYKKILSTYSPSWKGFVLNFRLSEEDKDSVSLFSLLCIFQLRKLKLISLWFENKEKSGLYLSKNVWGEFLLSHCSFHLELSSLTYYSLVGSKVFFHKICFRALLLYHLPMLTVNKSLVHIYLLSCGLS